MFFIDLIGFIPKNYFYIIINMFGTIYLSERDFDFIQGWITCTDLRRKGGGSRSPQKIHLNLVNSHKKKIMDQHMNYLNIRDTCHILCRYQYNKFAPVSTLDRLVYSDASLVKVITKQLNVPVYWFLVVSLLLYEDATLWCGCPIVISSSLSSFLNVWIFILLGGDKGITKLSSPSFVSWGTFEAKIFCDKCCPFL